MTGADIYGVKFTNTCSRMVVGTTPLPCPRSDDVVCRDVLASPPCQRTVLYSGLQISLCDAHARTSSYTRPFGLTSSYTRPLVRRIVRCTQRNRTTDNVRRIVRCTQRNRTTDNTLYQQLFPFLDSDPSQRRWSVQ